MKCRPLCGACCIAPAIVQPFYGMPRGKPAGQACVHLESDMSCALYDDPRRPSACAQFAPEQAFCGYRREEALDRLGALETATAPEPIPVRSLR